MAASFLVRSGLLLVVACVVLQSCSAAEFTPENLLVNLTQNSLVPGVGATLRGSSFAFGVSFTHNTIAPCAIRQIHEHPRGDELIFTAQGFVKMGLIFENNTVYYPDPGFGPGQGILFPRGLPHFFWNPTCNRRAVLVSAFDNGDFGQVNLGPAMNALRSGVVYPTASDMSKDELFGVFQSHFSGQNPATRAEGFILHPGCVQRCFGKRSPPPPPSPTRKAEEESFSGSFDLSNLDIQTVDV